MLRKQKWLNPCRPNPEQTGKERFFSFSRFSLVLQKAFVKTFRPSRNLFEVSQKSLNMSSCHFLFQLIILWCLGQEGLKKVFLLGLLLIFKKIATNMKLAFTNVRFRHNSACVIQKWLRFKRVILSHQHISHDYFLMNLKS